jgi:hypothetical protein
VWFKKENFLFLVKEIWERPLNRNDPIYVLNIKLKCFKKILKVGDRNYLVLKEK